MLRNTMKKENDDAMQSSISQNTQKSRQDMEITMYKTEVCDDI